MFYSNHQLYMSMPSNSCMLMHKQKNDTQSTLTHEALYDLLLITINMAKLSVHNSGWRRFPMGDVSGALCTHSYTGRKRPQRYFAFNEHSSKHMRSLCHCSNIADASDDKNDICEHLLWKLKLALERNIDFVFRLCGPIWANRFTQPDQSENSNGVAVIYLI